MAARARTRREYVGMSSGTDPRNDDIRNERLWRRYGHTCQDCKKNRHQDAEGVWLCGEMQAEPHPSLPSTAAWSFRACERKRAGQQTPLREESLYGILKSSVAAEKLDVTREPGSVNCPHR
eukprot:2845839-Pleurochrysis_carterae.AAC.2